MSERQIVSVARVECDFIEADWDFASERSDAIALHWRARVEKTPELFNGRVLLLHHGQVEPAENNTRVFRGACFATDFAAFMAWREFGFPQSSARNIFSMAALETSDGAFVLGEMAAHTAPAGQIYFPSGTPDLSDVRDGHVDIDGSAARELREETGLDPTGVQFMSGLDLVIDPVRVCCMKRVLSDQSADTLVDTIHGWLAQDDKPELARMHIVRSIADLDPAMPDFVAAYLRHRFAVG